MALEKFARHLTDVLTKQNIDAVVLLSETLMFQNRKKKSLTEFSIASRKELFEWMTLQSGEHPWAFEIELDVLEVNIAKLNRAPVIDRTCVVSSFLSSYLAVRGKSPGKSSKLVVSLYRRLPIFSSLLQGRVNGLNRLLHSAGSRLRIQPVIL